MTNWLNKVMSAEGLNKLYVNALPLQYVQGEALLKAHRVKPLESLSISYSKNNQL